MNKNSKNLRDLIIVGLVLSIIFLLWIFRCCFIDCSPEIFLCENSEFPDPKEDLITLIVPSKTTMTSDEFSDQPLSLNSLVEILQSDTSTNSNDFIEAETVIDTNYISELVIYFDYDSYILKDLYPSLISEITAKYLEYERVSIEVESHTDSRGPDNYNIQLSEKRTESIVVLLDGLKSDLDISIQNKGESELVNLCTNEVICSDEDHQENRRSIIRFFALDKRSKSVDATLNDFSSYKLTTDLAKTNDSIHDYEVQLLRSLNSCHVMEQLQQNYLSKDFQESCFGAKSSVIEYFANSSSSKLSLEIGLGTAAYDFVIEENEANEFVLRTEAVVQDKIDESYNYIACQEIGVFFMDKIDEELKKEIIKVANFWFWEYNVKGFYIENDESNKQNAVRLKIRLQKNEFTSQVGCDKPSKLPDSIPTMKISNVDQVFQTDKDYFHHLVLHEFGHVLERHHEFLHDDVLPLINPALYADHYKKNTDTPFSKEQLETSFKQGRLMKKGISIGKFDITSVMNYNIPAEVIEGYSQDIVASYQLSNMDSTHVKENILNFLSINLKP